MTDVFDQPEGEAPETNPLDQLVGEGKKFRDVSALAKGKLEADNHISNLEQELAELRTELKARLTLEEMMSSIETKRGQPNSEMPDTRRQEPEVKNTSDIDLAAEVQKLLRQERLKETRESNLASTRAALRERFGDDYNNKLTEISNELGVSVGFLKEMGETSPAGFIKLIDSVAKPDDKRPLGAPTSMKSTVPVDPSVKKDAAYFRKLRKENPSAYFSRQVQKEMHDQALRLGEAFFN